MPFACNIDRRGKRLRAAAGAVTLLLAIGYIVWRWPMSGGEWLLAVLLLVISLFQLFEAWKGWCAIRAMGFRTPM